MNPKHPRRLRPAQPTPPSRETTPARYDGDSGRSGAVAALQSAPRRTIRADLTILLMTAPPLLSAIHAAHAGKAAWSLVVALASIQLCFIMTAVTTYMIVRSVARRGLTTATVTAWRWSMACTATLSAFASATVIVIGLHTLSTSGVFTVGTLVLAAVIPLAAAESLRTHRALRRIGKTR